MGKLYVDVHGTLEITNITTGAKCTLVIHRQGWTNKNAYKVEGDVLDTKGKKRFHVSGLWNDHLNIKDLSSGEEERVFEVDKRPAQSDRMYAFGYFSINLNYIDDFLRRTIPPTDSRRRTD